MTSIARFDIELPTDLEKRLRRKPIYFDAGVAMRMPPKEKGSIRTKTQQYEMKR